MPVTVTVEALGAGAVAIQEGPWLYAQVLGAPTDRASLVGRNVTVTFVDHGPQQKIAAFRLA